MEGAALLFAFLFLPVPPIELEEDVFEMPGRHFEMPLWIDREREGAVEKIEVFVSEDRGETWKHLDVRKPGDGPCRVLAPADGLYWFSVQVTLKDGKRIPREISSLQPMRKVFVNEGGHAIKRKKT